MSVSIPSTIFDGKILSVGSPAPPNPDPDEVKRYYVCVPINDTATVITCKRTTYKESFDEFLRHRDAQRVSIATKCPETFDRWTLRWKMGLRNGIVFVK